eukprot:Plantae.Rhodophyta-Rhodochaete_pulchella.ctg4560.p1 GENE.Plantae.Rhodophyta-Rhodochaete_pulchella.ctg4560~~Plantae.Rhodophyta-Rhodochaete_pulchella.ctg4560.p1  ORF type:complete len:177 (+),score=17.58 Plantae.Rhodophyta-Rhodochaete_pulchella.ctg4560:49-531(+)
MYVESAYDYNLSSPYKTSVVKIVTSQTTNGRGETKDVLELVNYKIKDADDFWFAAHEPELLEDLKPDMLIQMPDCCNTIYEWIPHENRYKAYTRPGKACVIHRKGVDTYLDSVISLNSTRYSSWDVGRDPETDEYVWGGSSGPFDFVANKRFTDLVPEGP